MPRKGRTSAGRRQGDRETEGKIGETAAASLESTRGRDGAGWVSAAEKDAPQGVIRPWTLPKRARLNHQRRNITDCDLDSAC